MTQDRIVYFTGMHGTGKTTLIATLQEHYGHLFVLSDKPKLPKTNTVDERPLVRLARAYLQALSQREQAEQHPDKFVLADRSCMDPLPYAKAFEELGWTPTGHYARVTRVHAGHVKNHRSSLAALAQDRWHKD
ncbi:AAA family ATPase [Candidatus Woesearchaeota archaeon]|nr:AAA family ATPase [Candidatus Woesearchaeota archaeon]